MKKYLLTIIISILSISFIQDVHANDVSIGIAYAIGIEDGKEYQDDIILITSGSDQRLLDGVEVPEGFVINVIGNHTLELYDSGVLQETINFTIIPRFDNDVIDVTYFNSAKITLENSGTLLINNRVVENGTKFNKIGNYKVTVQGVNDYEVSYTFTIEDFKLKTVDGREYHSLVIVDIDKFVAVYMDNQKVTKDIRLSDYGNYSIRVLGLNGFMKTYEFSIGPNLLHVTDGETYTSYRKLEILKAQKLTVDGVEIPVVKYLSVVGNHEVIYYGLNGYEKVYNITIAEPDLGFEGVVIKEFSLPKKDFTLYLNGVVYVPTEKINKIGNYTLTVSGVNGYTNEYHFQIWQETPMPEAGAELTEAFNINTHFNRVVVNGVLVKDGYRITKTGDYEVLLEGVGDYSETYYFSYTNGHVEIAKGIYILTAVFGGMTVILYGVVLWRRFK